MSEEEEEEAEKLSLSSLFLSQISQFCSLIISHPLYFSYILFFSPYILKLLSFLSPLLTTTFLLLLLPFLFTFFSHNSHQNQDHHHQFLLDEWFNNFFNTPSEITIIQFPLLEVDEEQEIKKEETKEHHDITENGIIKGNSSKEEKMGTNYNKSFLECKVFEDEEKMDLLWEKYEDKEMVVVEEEINKNNSCISKKKDLRSLVNQQKEMEKLEEEEEEEEEANGKICCLQALKFSTSKMRFGMGKKSGLRKISKAFKGLKLLHQLTTNGKNKTHS